MTEEKRPQGRPRKGFKKYDVKLPPKVIELTIATSRALNITQATLWEQALTEFVKKHKVNTQ